MEFPYKSSFSSTVKPLVTEAKDKYLALASLQEIGKFIPAVDEKTNVDLLPVSFNACVINRVNKNDDVVSTETALAMYKLFINKPINVEHNRQKVIGTILTAGFSEFGTDRPMTEEEVKATKSPFNIVLGGIVWRLVNPDLTDKIEDSSDPTSSNYLEISASWELGFSEYGVVILDKGDKNIENAQIVTEATAVDKYSENLRAHGGKGTVDGKEIYRLIMADVLPLGIGFTENPAAEVVGVATKLSSTEPTIKEDSAKSLSLEQEEINKSSEIISQVNNSSVNIERSDMKIKSLTDITDENLKQASAAEISTIIADELRKASLAWEAEKKNQSELLAAAIAAGETYSKEIESFKEKVKANEAALADLMKEKEERASVDAFNSRMTQVSEKFELDEEASAAVVEEIKALSSDEAFAAWMKKAAILLKGFAKKAPVKVEKCKECGKEPCECEQEEEVAKKKKCKADEEAKAAQTTIDKALDNADKKSALPNTTVVTEPTLFEKYKGAFTKEGFVIKL